MILGYSRKKTKRKLMQVEKNIENMFKQHSEGRDKMDRHMDRQVNNM